MLRADRLRNMAPLHDLRPGEILLLQSTVHDIVSMRALRMRDGFQPWSNLSRFNSINDRVSDIHNRVAQTNQSL